MGRILLIAFMVFVSMHAGAAVIGSMKGRPAPRAPRGARARVAGQARGGRPAGRPAGLL